MIYFIGNEYGAIKIGYTGDFSAQGRLGGLQTANASQLTMLGREDGTPQDEGNLQAKFAHLRIRGEWFVADDKLLEYISSLPTTDKESIQHWVATMLPKGNTANLQRLGEQIRVDALNKAKNVLDEAKRQAQDVVMTAQLEQARKNVLNTAGKQARSIIGAARKQSQSIIGAAEKQARVRSNQIIMEAERKYKQIIDFATDCAASDIKELIVSSCNPSLSNYLCCKCGRARHTVKEREDGFPWCDPCWVNHSIFDSGRFDAIVVRALESHDATPV